MNALVYVLDVDNRPTTANEDELLTLNAHMSAATYRFLTLARAFDERAAWGDIGMRSMAHWLNWRCGIALGAAREQMRVALALHVLPRTAQALALAAGTISYSKVRALTRVARADTETFFLEAAEYSTASQLEKLVRLAKQGMALDDADRLWAMVERCRCDWHYDDDGILVLHARLMPDDGARLVKAMQAMEVQNVAAPADARRASALAALADAAVGEEGKVPVPEIVVHVRTKSVSAETSAEIEDADAISTATAERLCCDAAVVQMRESATGEPLSIGRRTRTIPPAIRRAMNARDRGCRFPGCTHTRFLHGHHVQHWAHQGETSLENLVTLCSYHHTLVHEGGYTIGRSSEGAFEFFTPTGKRVETSIAARMGRTANLIQHNNNRGLDVSAETCVSKWDGPRADYDLILTALFHNTHSSRTAVTTCPSSP